MCLTFTFVRTVRRISGAAAGALAGGRAAALPARAGRAAAGDERHGPLPLAAPALGLAARRGHQDVSLIVNMFRTCTYCQL